MTVQDFFQNLLKSQELDSDQINQLREHREEVEGFLRKKFGDEPTIRYAGSKAKETMIAESYDLDLICYFPHDKDMTLKEIHDEVEEALSSVYLTERKASAIRIKKNESGVESDYHIDVVPGKFIDGDDGDAFLHVAYGDKERIQTNIDTHIAYIKNSGFQNVIKLLKLWKVRNTLPLKTFVAEILTVKTLTDSKKDSNYAVQLKTILEELRDNLESIKLEDPANSKNIVSQTMDAGEKSFIAAKAEIALNTLDQNQDDELLGWKKIFNEEISKNFYQPRNQSKPFSPRSPWCLN